MPQTRQVRPLRIDMFPADSASPMQTELMPTATGSLITLQLGEQLLKDCNLALHTTQLSQVSRLRRASAHRNATDAHTRDLAEL